MGIPSPTGKGLTQRRIGPTIATVIGATLCVAALLGCQNPAEGASSNANQPARWTSVKYQDSIAGDPVRGQRVAQEHCAACHGADGNSTDPQYPKLAGQSLPYLYWELRAFKLEIRKSDVMAPNLAPLSYTDLADVADYYSRQTRRPDGMGDSRVAAIGERLFYSGMPSCAICHSAAGARGMPMMGMRGNRGMMGRGMMGRGMMGPGMANVPNLNGQHAAYIVNQLNRFASGERQGTVMNRVAVTLSEANKREIAAFLSGTP